MQGPGRALGRFLLIGVFLVKIVVRAAIALLFAFTLGKLMLGDNGFLRQIAIAQQNETMKEGNDSLAQMIATMENNKHRLLIDSAYMEEVARTRFGMSRAGETVYRFLAAQDSLPRNESTQPPRSDGDARQGVTVTKPD